MFSDASNFNQNLCAWYDTNVYVGTASDFCTNAVSCSHCVFQLKSDLQAQVNSYCDDPSTYYGKYG